MKKLLCILTSVLIACTLSGCKNPDSYQLDLSQGYGSNLKLIHLNASTGEKRERIETFYSALRDSDPLDKDFSLFAFYPDYKLVLNSVDLPQTVTAIVDLNGDYVDFYYPGPYPEASQKLYRSRMSAADFRKLVHHI